MKTIQLILMLAVLLYAGGCSTPPKISAADKQGLAFVKPRHAFASLPVKYQTLLRTWLSQDCRVDSGIIETDMASAGPILEEALWEAYNLGPTEDERADLQNSLRERYALRLRWLKQNGPEAVKSPAYKDLLTESEEQFSTTEMAKLVNRWRDAAVSGLGFVCTTRSLERLRLIAKNENNSPSIAASEALKTSGNCNVYKTRKLDSSIDNPPEL